MDPVTDFCKDDKEVPGIVGTKSILSCICILLQIFISGFAIKNICLSRNVGNGTSIQIPRQFQCLIFVYHTCAWLALLLSLAPSIPIFFDIETSFDYATNMGCNISHFWIPLAMIGVFGSSIYFWYFRLVTIFRGTIYSISTTSQKIIVGLWMAALVSATFSTIAAILISHIEPDDDHDHDDDNDGNYIFMSSNKDSELFCKYKIHVMDFLPIIQPSDDISYNYKINHFYGCRMNGNHTSYYLLAISYLSGWILVPLMNGYLFFQFVAKMRKLFIDQSSFQLKRGIGKTTSLSKINLNSKHGHAAPDIDPFDAGKLYYIYLNCVVGASSVTTTLLSMLLVMVYHYYFLPLVYFDVLLNGYFILLVYHFGGKILPKCCRKQIWRFVKIKKSRLQARSMSASSNDVDVEVDVEVDKENTGTNNVYAKKAQPDSEMSIYTETAL